jgi:hypothetical protein
MPPTLSHRQERFCQLVAQGLPPYRAYPEAGYSANPGSPYRLHENARVKARLAEIKREFAMSSRVTVESLSAELDEARALALGERQASAAVAATTAKAKLHGLMVDRTEKGAPGDFASASNAAEVLALVKAELGDETALLLAAALAKGNPAQVEPRGEGDALN